MAQKRILASGKTRWIGRYRDAGGKEHVKSFPLKREAVLWEAENKSKVSAGTWVDPAIAAKITLKSYLEKWRDRGRAEGTRKDRQQLIDNVPEISHLPLSAITEEHLVDWVRKMREGRPWANGEPLAESVVRNRISQLRAQFRRAQDRGIIVRNPAATFKSEPVNRAIVKPREVPSDDDIQKLLDAANTGGNYVWEGKDKRAPASPWLADAIILSVTTGLRAGEVGGLWTDDVDWAVGNLNIARQSGHQHDTVRPLKSATSERTIPAPNDTMAMLRRYRAGKSGDQALLTNRVGNGITAISISARFVEVRRLAGVREEISFHGFRHYYATRLIRMNVPVTTVAKLLGHATSSTTLRVYAHFIPGAEEQAREAVESFFPQVRESSGNSDEGQTLNLREAAGQGSNVIQFRPRPKR